MPLLVTLSSGCLSVTALLAAMALGRSAWRSRSGALWWAAGGVLAVGLSAGLLTLAVWLPGYDMSVIALELCAAALFGVSAWRLTCAVDAGREERRMTTDPDPAAWAARIVDLASSGARPSWGRALEGAPVMLAAVNEDGELLRVDGGLVRVKETARHTLTMADVEPTLRHAREVREYPMGNGRLIVALGDDGGIAC